MPRALTTSHSCTGVLLSLLITGCAATPRAANHPLPRPPQPTATAKPAGTAVTVKSPAPATSAVPAAVPSAPVKTEPAPTASMQAEPKPKPKDDPYHALERCPPEMTLLPGNICIDRWEAALVKVLADGSQQRWSPYRSPGRHRLMAISKRNVVPQGYINGRQAAAACKAAGKRLCQRTEWETACRGPEDTQFPYGQSREPKSCNDDGRGRHPVAEASGRLGWSMDRMWREGMDHAIINQLPNTVEKTGSHAACTNDYGAFDMVGNLHEWIADPDGTFRGGFFMDTKINGDGCDYATTAHSTRYHDYSIGFRCCKDAQDD